MRDRCARASTVLLFQECLYVCTERAAANMAYQGLLPGEFGQVKFVLRNVLGAALIGQPLAAPMTPYATIYTWPMMNIKADKGARTWPV